MSNILELSRIKPSILLIYFLSPQIKRNKIAKFHITSPHSTYDNTQKSQFQQFFVNLIKFFLDSQIQCSKINLPKQNLTTICNILFRLNRVSFF